MTDNWMNNAVTEVIESLDEERRRTRVGFSTDVSGESRLNPSSRPEAENIWQSRDPDVSSLRAGSGYDLIWRMLPALKDIPAEMLQSLLLGKVLQLKRSTGTGD